MVDIDRLIEAAKVMEEPPPTEKVTMGAAATKEVTMEPITSEAEAVDDVAMEALAMEETTEDPTAVEVINLDIPTPAVPSPANRRKPMAISGLPDGFIAISHKLEHVQFWKKMKLYDFVNLD
ncbi:unnamed protein product [Calypogeia fissa]